MARERLAGGRPADAGGRRHHGQRRDLLLGPAGARARARYDFGWLDRLLDLLHANGIRVDLGTPTVVPAGLVLPRPPRGAARDSRTARASRSARAAPSATATPTTAAAAANITTRLAERYGDHPALAHVARAQRVRRPRLGLLLRLLRRRTSAAGWRRRTARSTRLNEAWGTAFWGQRYADLGEIDPPRTAPTVGNPGQALDYKRFADATMRENFAAERDILHRLSPGIPVTTNFMTALSQCDSVDYWAWGREVDLVTNDHYLITDGRRTHVNLAMAADLTRSVAGGAPWLLLEHSTSGVNWQPRNPAKAPGQMARNSLAHVARGSDGRHVLPVAAVPARRREVPLGDAPARRHRDPGVARGGRTRRPPATR